MMINQTHCPDKTNQIVITYNVGALVIIIIPDDHGHFHLQVITSYEIVEWCSYSIP